MSTVNKFGAAKLLDPTNATLDGQARVNAEIFTAVEILGRKLERVEEERNRLARRLALIESAATVDEKTGKLYLPVVMNEDAAPVKEYVTPKWMVPVSLMSSAIALFALGMVMFRTPAPALTKEQVALLESLRNSQFTQLAPDSKGWKSITTEPQDNVSAASSNNAPVASSETPAPAATLPASAPTPSQPVAAALSQPLPQPQVPTAQQPIALTTPPPAPLPTAQVAAIPATQPSAPPAAQLPSLSDLARQEQTAQPPKPVEASTVPPSLPATAKTKAASAENINPDNVVIPGEDEDTPEQADNQAADKGKTTTAVAESKSAGGIAPDPALPKKLAKLQKRAYQGIPEAQHDLATIYAAGTLVPQDYHRAAFWFTKAADGGVANAHYNMGVIYHQGLGVPVDMAKALDWYGKAAELGHPEAMYNLGIAYIEGIGTKVDIDKGVSYFKRAAKAGVVQAAYNLGVLYESNFIGPIDTKKAIEWYKVAAKAGHAQARDALARMQANGSMADSGDQALKLADKVEPSAGGDDETGEGDSSPVAETAHKKPQGILADIQRILIKQGVLPGQPDGVLSQQTEDAIRSTQKKLGMSEDGQPSQELLEKLLQAPPPADKQFP